MNQSNSNREASIQRAKKIATVLSSTPMTAAEINAALGESYTPLQIANAVKFISGVIFARTTRMTRNTKGLQVEKEYAAYYLEGPDAGAVSASQSAGRLQPDGGAPARRPAASKAEQQGQAQAIASVLTHTPMTVREINAALHSDYTALQVANAVKQIPDAGTCKVRRMTANIRGEKAERDYTAYFIHNEQRRNR